jgi:hypothetical protein
MADAEDYILNAACAEQLELVRYERPAVDIDHRLWDGLRDGSQACS